MGDLSNYFSKSEFKCKCGCDKLVVANNFISKLDLARNFSKTPYIINSGYRCQKNNAAVGGKPDSAHTKGLAADIKTNGSRQRFQIIKGLIEAGFTRIGIDFDNNFVHVDMDKDKDPDVIWGY